MLNKEPPAALSDAGETMRTEPQQSDEGLPDALLAAVAEEPIPENLRRLALELGQALEQAQLPKH